MQQPCPVAMGMHHDAQNGQVGGRHGSEPVNRVVGLDELADRAVRVELCG